MFRNCKCGGHIASNINMFDLAECLDCQKCYVFKNGSWIETPKNEFRVIYMQRLIEHQKSNK